MELRLPQHPTNTLANSSFIYCVEPGKGLYNIFFNTNDHGSKIRPTMVENVLNVNNDKQKEKEKVNFFSSYLPRCHGLY